MGRPGVDPEGRSTNVTAQPRGPRPHISAKARGREQSIQQRTRQTMEHRVSSSSSLRLCCVLLLSLFSGVCSAPPSLLPSLVARAASPPPPTPPLLSINRVERYAILSTLLPSPTLARPILHTISCSCPVLQSVVPFSKSFKPVFATIPRLSGSGTWREP